MTTGHPTGDLLVVDSVRIRLKTRKGAGVDVVSDATLSVERGQIAGLVGESGSGKTMLCRSLLGTLDRYGGHVAAGSIRYDGTELVGATESVWRSIRGSQIAYVPQASMSALNPTMTVGAQLAQVIRVSTAERLSRHEVRNRAADVLDSVSVYHPGILQCRPHQLSGGMRQRVVIGAALSRNPRLLIADEPTTALDVTVQKGILELLTTAVRGKAMSLVFVTHDLSIVREICDTVTIMRAGHSVETGPTAHVLDTPAHPYTYELVHSSVGVPGQSTSSVPGAGDR